MPYFKKSKGYKMKGFSGFGNSPLKTSGADIIKAQAKLDEVELGYKTPRWLKAAEGEGKNEETPAPSPTKVKIDISSEDLDKIMKMIASENEKNRKSAGKREEEDEVSLVGNGNGNGNGNASNGTLSGGEAMSGGMS